MVDLKQFEQKTSDELLEMYKKPDDWLPEVIQEVKRLLVSRGVPLSEVTSPVPVSASQADSDGRSPKPAKAFLWWGGFLVFSWLAYLGPTVVARGSMRLIFSFMTGICLTGGICWLWFFLSKRKLRRSIFPRVVGSTFFALGSVIPLRALPELLALDSRR